MIFDVMPPGTYGRVAIGLVVLTHLIAYNETGAITVLFSAFIATICAIFSAFCKSSLNNLQLPYLRATHKSDFFLMFLALWMDIMTLICACGALTRTLSICLDAMTGGLARIYILGRNAPENEPWPDVIGFSIIFVVSVMFMLGLENSNIFSCIMLASMMGIIGILATIASIRGNLSTWQLQNWLPKGFTGLIGSSALLVFAFPSELPATGSCRRFTGVIICMFVCLTITFTSGCLSTVLTFSPPDEFIAVPILSILETIDFHNFEPAVACLLVLICSSAFLELFSEMFNLIVKLTTSEWKILSREIGYEHGDSGSPVLAVFTGGSICSMIAFACPMEIIIYLVAGSQLCSGLLRGFYLLYSPFRPKYIMNSSNDTSLAYSRLQPTSTTATTMTMKQSASCPTVSNVTSGTTAGNVSRRILRCLSKPTIVPMPKSKSRCKTKKRDEELEREWLLLGEPTSPRNTVILDDEQDTSSLTVAAAAVQSNAQDIEAMHSPVINIISGESNNSDSNSSTDIDAIVDEYRQKVKITTAGPSEKVMRIPSIESWRVSIVLVVLTMVGVLISVVGVLLKSIVVLIGGVLAVTLFSLIMLFLPRYNHSETSPNVLFCSLTILLESILLGSTLLFSLPAIIAWIIAGILIFTRCDTWFSLCIEQPIYISHIITPSAASTATSSGTHLKSMIRLPRPPKGAVISTRVHGHCR